jgi:cold shock CspA family protein
MEGNVKTFLSDKKYGFIKGNDGKDYYFRSDAFKNKTDLDKICDGALVEFDGAATPKGYRANSCVLLEQSKGVGYEVPHEFMTSKSSTLSGWEIIEHGDWIVHGTSSDSPDSAKKQIIENARRVGANALLNIEYYKTTGSNGNYNYSIHNFKGRIAIAAKKSLKGEHGAEALIGINQRAETEMSKYLEAKLKYDKEVKKSFTWLAVVVVPATFMAVKFNLNATTLLFIVLAIFYFSFRKIDGNIDGPVNVDWLQKAN